LLASSFRYYFTGSLTLLFTFPSRYSFTIGYDAYLALECGHPSFPPEFAVSEGTQEHLLVWLRFRIHDYHVLRSGIPTCFSTLTSTVMRVLQPPELLRGLGFSLFARRLLRESLTISIPQGT
jgi:hypothetical protein